MEKIKKYSPREIIFAVIFMGLVLSISSGSTIYLYWLIEEFIAYRSTILFHTYNLPSVGLMLLLYFLLNVVFSTIFLMIITKYIIRPVYQISEASNKVAKGDYTVKVEKHRGFKFINRTIDNFNLMVKHLNSVEMIQSDFISNVSHEIKTPLSAIEGYATLLQDNDKLTDEERKYLKKIVQHSNHLTQLVEDILIITKFDNQQIADNKNWYRLDEQIRKAILFLAPKIRKKNIRLNVSMDKIDINANSTMLYHVWHNILSNAIKFSDTNSCIDISAKLVESNIVVKIRDYGVGMSQSTIDHMYEKFYQAEETQHYGGNGLGLCLVKRILEICNGKISVESQLGEGTCFTIILKQNDI